MEGNLAQEDVGTEDGRMVAESAAFDALHAIESALASDQVLGWLPADVTAQLEGAQKALTRVFPKPDYDQNDLPF